MTDLTCGDCGDPIPTSLLTCPVCGWQARPVVLARPADPTPDAIPVAFARYAGIGSSASGARRIIVDSCPYCGHTHRHIEALGETANQRLADCFRGEYVLQFAEVHARPAEVVEPIEVCGDCDMELDAIVMCSECGHVADQDPGGSGGGNPLHAAALAADQAWKAAGCPDSGPLWRAAQIAGVAWMAAMQEPVEPRVYGTPDPLWTVGQSVLRYRDHHDKTPRTETIARVLKRYVVLETGEKFGTDGAEWGGAKNWFHTRITPLPITRPVAPQDATLSNTSASCSSEAPSAAPTGDRPAVATVLAECACCYALGACYDDGDAYVCLDRQACKARCQISPTATLEALLKAARDEWLRLGERGIKTNLDVWMASGTILLCPTPVTNGEALMAEFHGEPEAFLQKFDGFTPRTQATVTRSVAGYLGCDISGVDELWTETRMLIGK